MNKDGLNGWRVGVMLLVLLPGCAHFEDRPIDPQSNQSAFEARTLADPGLMAFMEKIRPDADVSKDWNATDLTLAAFCLNLVPAPFPYLGPSPKGRNNMLFLSEHVVRHSSDICFFTKYVLGSPLRV